MHWYWILVFGSGLVVGAAWVYFVQRQYVKSADLEAIAYGAALAMLLRAVRTNSRVESQPQALDRAVKHAEEVFELYG